MIKLPVYVISALLLLAGMQVRAVDYKLPDLDGQIQSLEQYKGKWLIVNYWATWCGTCRKELPELISLHEANKDKDIVVVGINFESISPEAVRAFVNDQAIPYPVLLSKPVRGTPLGEVPALPTTYIINPDGKLMAGQIGMVGQLDLEAYINQNRTSEKQANLSNR